MPHKDSPPGYLSVTEVLDLCIHKKFLYYWAGKNGLAKCEQIKRESQEIGIEVHRVIEETFKDMTAIETDPNTTRMVQNFWNKFVIPFEVKPIALEVTMRDEKLKLQGTLDSVVNTNKWDDITVDYKTSNQLDLIGVPLQLSMYDYLRKGSGKGAAVRIDKEEDTVQIKWYDDLQDYQKVWKAALRLARYIKFKEL